MKHILNALAFAHVLALLVPTIADACSAHKRKPVHCTSYTNFNGTTRSTCR